MSKKSRKSKYCVSTQVFVSLLALVLVMGVAVGGTIAWLTADTTPVVNTFTVGDININLSETTGTNYKIIPGTNITKDPKVTVQANSEACWLFVKIDEANWPTFTTEGGTKKISYTVDSGWIALEGQTGVYYREVSATDAAVGKEYAVIANNTVTVSSELTKTEINSMTANPTLTFTAYAVQKDNVATAADAWAKLNVNN